MKSYKRLYFVCKNLYLLAYKSADAARKSGELLFSVHLKGCEVTPALNLTANKYEVKLEVPSAEGMTEMFLRFISVGIESSLVSTTPVTPTLHNSDSKLDWLSLISHGNQIQVVLNM